ncbi:hypothetical protein Sya03_55620 [Spirilliplanes yamanashiensis]|uniref:Uncharacterized protein n=1 Tax=Spirilliplanes yamanashiensis TaxID=42233 RepID=A0A8J4DMI7_9ACTN|nr:hypothetical protein Sya03_55620 [Spirilliplanes yamanashiensis]
MGVDPLAPLPGRPSLGPLKTDLSPALRATLLRWVETQLLPTQAGDRVLAVATALDIPLLDAFADEDVIGSLEYFWRESDGQLLDVVHATLHVLANSGIVFRPPQPYEEVEKHLALGRSVWQATATGLVRRVEAATQAALEWTTMTADAASAELKEAWEKATSREGDPSDAWDHAIKAVEAVLIPIVVPTQVGPHLGHVLGQLDRHGQLWEPGLRYNQTKPPDSSPRSPVEALVGVLRLIYPNPDRHVGPGHRTPTAAEARVVVQLAMTVVQWAREGLIVKR